MIDDKEFEGVLDDENDDFDDEENDGVIDEEIGEEEPQIEETKDKIEEAGEDETKEEVKEDVLTEEEKEAAFTEVLNRDEYFGLRHGFRKAYQDAISKEAIDRRIEDKIEKLKLSEELDKKMLVYNSKIAMQQALIQQIDEHNISRYLYSLARFMGINKNPNEADMETLFKRAITDLPKMITSLIDRIVNGNIFQMETEIARKKEVESLRLENTRRAEIIHKYANRIRQLEKDFGTFRDRAKRLEDDHIRQQSSRVFEEIIPVFEHMERALKEFESRADDPIVKGFSLIAQELTQALGRLGITRIETVGRICDYNEHEILMAEENENYRDNEILAEFKPGYMFDGKVIKPAGVKVAINPKGLKPKEEEMESEDKPEPGTVAEPEEGDNDV